MKLSELIGSSTLIRTGDTIMNDANVLAELKSLLDSAVRAYEAAIMRTLLDEDEIRRAVDQCTAARQRFNEANNTDGKVKQVIT